ncbi:hypothetical protein E4U60_004251 [Claviceps pazoutovae]|uniref:Uncharacterized protein n=1 Tax=Claviceps pazoutovae TaxID=1649127 RepID=A0A9P7M9B2_9HYPO|nr:hypothetical protein E4U60_004251 [Claviceps pazoutovae]
MLNGTQADGAVFLGNAGQGLENLAGVAVGRICQVELLKVQGSKALPGESGQCSSSSSSSSSSSISTWRIHYILQRPRSKSPEPTDYGLVVSKLTRLDDMHMDISVADELQGQFSMMALQATERRAVDTTDTVAN